MHDFRPETTSSLDIVPACFMPLGGLPMGNTFLEYIQNLQGFSPKYITLAWKYPPLGEESYRGKIS
jgi:hypothetical protein